MVGNGVVGARPPNFVLILCDDLGYGDLGCYGSLRIETPRIDALAAEGMRFTDFYATAPFCSPSRASLLTGRYPARCGVPAVLFPTENHGLPPDEITLAESLKALGYATACVGKWHLGFPEPLRPHRQGFDSWIGLPYSNDSRQWAIGERFRPVFGRDHLPLMQGDEVIEAPVQQEEITARYTEEALKVIGDSGEKPFFLFLSHTFPHKPQYVRHEGIGKSAGGLYGDCVMEIDRSTGMVLDALDKAGVAGDSVVIFTSDNGPAPDSRYRPGNTFGERGGGGSTGGLRGHKGTTWEGGMRVPAIVRWPGTVAPGTECDAVASLNDILPTFLAAAGKTHDGVGIDGEDLGPLLRREVAPDFRRRPFFYLFGYQVQAVRRGPWKLVRQIDSLPARKTPSLWYQENRGLFAKHHRLQAEPLLFHLEDDPKESNNRAGTEPDLVRELESLAVGFEREIAKSRDLYFADGPEPPEVGAIRLEPARPEEPLGLDVYADAAGSTAEIALDLYRPNLHKAKPSASNPDPEPGKSEPAEKAGEAEKPEESAESKESDDPEKSGEPSGPEATEPPVEDPLYTKSLPLILLVSGEPEGRKATEALAIRLARSGFIVANAALADPESAPALFGWLHENAARYGIDFSRIGLLAIRKSGESAALTLLADRADAPENAGESRRGIAFIQPEFRAADSEGSLIPAINPQFPPVLFFDRITGQPGAGSQALHQALETAGVANELVLIPGPPDAWNHHPHFGTTAGKLVGFFRETLGE